MADFAPVIAFTLRAEGGYSCDPADPGGATNHGITLATLSAWRGHRCTAADVQALTVAEAEAIYTAQYWHVVGGPALPAGLDLVVFDFAVNAGPVRSIEMLQRVIGAAPDGRAGPETLSRACGAPSVIRARIVTLSNAHEAYYHTLPSYAHDGRGWSARVSACIVQALGLAAGAPVSVTPALPKPGTHPLAPTPALHAAVGAKPVPTVSRAQSTADALMGAELATLNPEGAE